MIEKDTNLKRWRMILGGDEADGTGVELDDRDKQIDDVLSSLYDYESQKGFCYGEEGDRKGGRGASSPQISRWLGDVRKYFPKSVVDIIQDDALSHPELKDKLMLEPEILEQAQPSVHLIVTLMELGKLIPSKTKETARRVVAKVVEELLEKLEQNMIQAITGALNRNVPNPRPTYHEIDWKRTILRNLKHYQEDYKTIIPQKLYGYGRNRRKSLKDIILCLDQSGSMGTSIIYSGIFGSVMASLPSVSTKMVVFDTEVVDLTQDLKDPVDLLFGVQLGGGTDINKALGYCQTLVSKPEDTILILITDLEEGGSVSGMLKKIERLKAQGVQIIVLLSLNDDGKPYYSQHIAKKVNALAVPVFACTPDKFPDLMATTINQGDIRKWAGDEGMVLVG